MKNVARLIGSVFLIAVLSGFPDYCTATKPTLPPFYAAIEPVGTPTIGEPTELRMRVVVRGEVECKDVNVLVAPVGGLTYTGEKSWTAHVTVDVPAAYVLTVVIPPNDTSGLDVTINGGGFCFGFGAIYFVTTEDTVEIYAGKPTHKRSIYSQPATTNLIKDTLTQEQLQTEYEVALDLRDSAHFKIGEKILGPIPESSKLPEHDGYYILLVRLDNLFKLRDAGIDIEFSTPPPWSKKYQRLKDKVSLPPSRPTTKPPKTDDIDVDTLTPEQLQSEHEVMLWFRDSTERNLVEQLVGPMQDSLRLHGRWSLFRVKMTLEKFLEIKEHKVDVHLLNPGQWWHQTPQDSFPQQIPQDTSKSQGVLDQLHKSVSQSASITLDHVDGLTAEDELSLNQPITFYLRVFNWWLVVEGLTNGFRIYSPDGAKWSTTSVDTIPLGWQEMFSDTFFTCSYNVDGEDADTVGYFGMAPYASGLPLMFDEVAFKITIGPIGDEYAGKTICLDSSFFGGAGYWLWSSCGGYCTYRPAWDGPHCFTIEPSQITFSGYIYYLDPVPPDTNDMPMRRIRIEMWDEDTPPLDPHDSLAIDTTSDNGYFSLGPVANEDGVLGGTLDIFFRIYAENEAAYVTESYNDDIHRIQTPVGDDLPGGVYDTTIVAPLDSSGPFFIADAILDGYNIWVNWRSAPSDDPGVVQVVFGEGVGTHYNSSEQAIHIDGVDNPAMQYPDTYDRDVILHEYGHRLEDVFDFFDNSPGGWHHWCQHFTLGLAASEAWATFYQNSVVSDSFYYDYWSDFDKWIRTNSENCDLVIDTIYPQLVCNANSRGTDVEGTVAGILWDIFDQADDDYNGDGRGDTLSMGIDTILIALLDRTVNGHRPDNIDEFWEAWFSTWWPGHGQAVMDIFYEHGEPCCNTDGIRGDVDYTGGSPNIGDLSFLVSYLFDQPPGPAPPCFEEGDVDASGSINVGDLSWLLSYLMDQPPGPAPAPCP